MALNWDLPPTPLLRGELGTEVCVARESLPGVPGAGELGLLPPLLWLLSEKAFILKIHFTE